MNKKKMSDRQKTYILMVIPALVLFVMFNTIPLITGAMYSFTNYRGYCDSWKSRRYSSKNCIW